MRLRRFNESIKEYEDEVSSIVQDLLDNSDYQIKENYNVNYHVSDTGFRKAFSLLIWKGDYVPFNIRKDKHLMSFFKRLEAFVKTINCAIHIDPENKYLEYVPLQEFIDIWGYDEVYQFDIIIYEQ